MSGISRIGGFRFEFSEDLKGFGSGRQLQGFDAIKFQIEEVEIDTNITRYIGEGDYFNVTIANFTESKLKMKITFLDPLLISNDGYSHKLIAKIVDPAFFSQKQVKNLLFTKEIP